MPDPVGRNGAEAVHGAGEGDYARAARRAKEAGFDGVEVHSGHGYLLSQWLCPHYNKRADGYGGPIENRARIHLEVVGAVCDAVGEGFAVGVKLNSEDFMSDGLTQDESLAVARMLQDAGIDFLEVSGGNEASPPNCHEKVSALCEK